MKPIEIKIARQRLGLSQEYVSKALGIRNPGTYQKKESGRVRFTDEEKIALAEVLQLTLEQFNDYLFDGRLPEGIITSKDR